MDTLEKRNSYERILFGFALAMLFAVSSLLFFWQAVTHAGPLGTHHSDLCDHIYTALNEHDYSLGMAILRAGYTLLHGPMGVALVLGMFVVLTAVMNCFFMHGIDRITGRVSYPCWYHWLAIALIFAGPIYVPYIYECFYIGTLGIQAWHNSTYIMVRAFSLAALILFFWLDGTYLEKINVPGFIAFAAVLTLSSAVKPNFFIAFAPLMACFLLYDLIKNRKGRKKVGRVFAFAATVLPSVIVLLVQSVILYSPGTDSSVAISFGEMYMLSGRPVGKFLFSTLFSIIVLLGNIKILKTEKWYRQSWLLFIVNLLISLCFVEVGPRRSHGNFEWGIILANYIMMLVSAYLLCHNFADYKAGKKAGTAAKGRSIYLIIAAAAGSAHLVSGLVYFARLLLGADFD